jgi:hypothetical protein
MKSLPQLLPLLLFSTIASAVTSAIVLPSQSAQAAEWVKITENSAKDSFFIDTSSIKKNGNAVTYWEYREFIEPNNPFLENPLEKEKPLYGVVIRWTADCGARTQRLRRVNAFTSNRELLQRFEYAESGTLIQPNKGSSSYEVLEAACNPKKLESTKPVTKAGDTKPTELKPTELKPAETKPTGTKPTTSK